MAVPEGDGGRPPSADAGSSQSSSLGGTGTGCIPDEVAGPPECVPRRSTRSGRGRRTKQTPQHVVQGDSAGSLPSGRAELAEGGEEEGLPGNASHLREEGLAGNASHLGEEVDGGLEEQPLGESGGDGGPGHVVPAGGEATGGLKRSRGARREFTPSTGIRGVYVRKHKNTIKFVVEVTVNRNKENKNVSLGTFQTIRWATLSRELGKYQAEFAKDPATAGELECHELRLYLHKDAMKQDWIHFKASKQRSSRSEQRQLPTVNPDRVRCNLSCFL